MSIAYRFRGTGQPYEGLARKVNGRPAWTNRVRVARNHLDDPLHWRAPRRIFVNSMADTFHELVEESTIALLFGIMALCPHHIFQVLTKRPERMAALLSDSGFPLEVWLQARNMAYRSGWPVARWPDPVNQPEACVWPLPNVWCGTSVEDQQRADGRIPWLLQTPAAIRWLSCEPLLGPLDLDRWLWDVRHHYDAETGEEYSDPEPSGALDWIVCGGESGSGHRPMDLAWAGSVQEQCDLAEVPFFFKQDSGPRAGMRPDALGRVHQQFPEVPACAV